jgi:hypothetical protein
MPRKIIDIEIDEISVVDRAANRKKFFIKKGVNRMDLLLKALQSFLGEDVVKEEDLKKAPLSEEQAKEIQDAVAVLVKWKAEFPDDVLAAVQSLMKSAVMRAPAPEPELAVEKVRVWLSKATIADLKKVKEVIDRLIQSNEEKPEDAKKGAGLPPEVAARLKKLDDLEAAEAESVRKAAADKETNLTATIKKLQDDLESLKKTKGQSLQKKAEGAEPGPDEVKKGEPFVWTSLQGREEA